MRKKLVALTGAGISAESGLRTFRDSDGLWEGYDVMQVATPEGWAKDPDLVNEFYNMRRRQSAEALPNDAHRILAALQDHFDVLVVTQNIDDLHERAGSRNVLHLHGEIGKMRTEHDPDTHFPITGDIAPGSRDAHGARYRPQVVWFGEDVPLITEAAARTAEADIFLVVGTSLAVYPAAGLLYEVPPGIPVYVVDRRIPEVRGVRGLHPIELPATQGMRVVYESLTGEAWNS